MAKRMIIMLCAVAVFLGVIGFVKYGQIQTAIAQGASFQPPPEAVTTTIAKEEVWQETLGVIGTVTAVNGVTISADLPGIVEKISFSSGEHVQAGKVLAHLDARQEEAQLEAAKARLGLAQSNFDRAQGLRTSQVISQSEYDAAVTALDQARAESGEIQATIDRKTIRAPFSGILGLREADLGQYLNSGDPIVPLQSLDPIYVNFAVPQQQLARIRPGVEVRISTDQVPSVERTGKITATNSTVDESTRNLQMQATFANRDGALKPGMFVKGNVVLDVMTRVVPLPSTAISYAPYGNSVYIVENAKGDQGGGSKKVRQQFVKLGGARGDLVAILDGVKEGEEVVTSGAFKLRNDAPVKVNNDTIPPSNPAPAPENS